MITRSSGFARRTLVAFLAGALILMAASRSAEASPFVINLLGSSGGGGGGGASSPVGSAGFGMGGASTTGIPNVTLRGLGLQLTSSRMVEPTGLNGSDRLGKVQQIATQAQIASGTGFTQLSLSETSGLVSTATVVRPITYAAIANLNLGDGEYLAVSPTVAQSLIENVPGDVPVSNEHIVASSGASPESVGTNSVDHDTVGSLASGASHSNSPNSVNADANLTTTVRAILSDVATDIVAYSSESTGGLSGSDVNGLSPGAALDSTPEPASLLLLGSGLALGARFVRRRKYSSPTIGMSAGPRANE